MNSKDENSSDHRSTASTNIDLQNKSERSINNNKNNKVCSSVVSQLSASFENGSMHAPTMMQTPLSVTIEKISIYNVRTNLQRNCILVAVSMLVFLVPFGDAIYFPTLDDIMNHLNTSNTLIVMSSSVFVFAQGIFSLLWGSISDRFGRKTPTIVALIIFLLATVGCALSINIIVLIVSRAIQGGALSATLVIGQSVVADIYPEEGRGLASGVFFLCFNLGDTIGPVVGGFISNAFGWRSIFICLGIYSCITIVAMFVLVPETHQYFVKERFHKANPEKHIIDAMPNELLPFENPWNILTYLLDLRIAPYIALSTTTVASLLTSITLFSTYLTKPPYSYTEAIIGLLFIPSGIALLIGSLFGGWVSDKANEYYSHTSCPEKRLVPVLILSILTPVGLILYGWTFQYKLHVAGPIIGQVLLSLGQSVLEPSISAYLTITKQEKAAAVSAANSFCNFSVSGIIITVAVPLQNATGTGFLFSLLSGINVVAIVAACIQVYKSTRLNSYAAEQKDDMTLGLEEIPLLKHNISES